MKIDLEALASNIEVLGEKGKEILRVAQIEGYVIKVEGRKDNSNKKYLHIHLNPKTQRDGIERLNFYGMSPIRGGDKIRAWLILDEKVIKYHAAGKTLFLEIIDERGKYLRRDFSDEYTVHLFDAELSVTED